jgi:ribosome recycling factor
MAYNFSEFKTRVLGIEEWLKKEFSLLRTGRATSAILDSITVDSYGTQSPIAHVGNIVMEDARTLRVTPWDKTQVKAIEGAITKADLGLSVSTDESGVRVIFPELTGERRAQIIKLLKQKLEDARISLRKERENVLNDFKQKEKEGEMSEDDHFKGKEELQKHVDEANRRFEQLAEKKEAEIISQ